MIFENYSATGSRRVGSDDYKTRHWDWLLRLMRSCTAKPNDSPSVRRSNEPRAGPPDTACLLSGGRRQLHLRPDRAGPERAGPSRTVEANCFSDWLDCVCWLRSHITSWWCYQHQPGVCVCVCVLSWWTRRLISQDAACVRCPRIIPAQALSYIRSGLPDWFHGSSDYLAAIFCSAAYTVFVFFFV